AELVEALGDRLVRLVAVVTIVPELGGDEELRAVDAALRDRRAHALFVAVARGSVDVTITRRQRLADGLLRRLRIHLEDAVAELRNRMAVIECDRRNRHATSLRWRAMSSADPVITYPPELPVSAAREEIADAIRDNQVVVIAG